VDTNDTRIPSTPVYRDGLISWGLNTGLNNATQTVPGILWGQAAPKLNDNGSLNSASLLQQGDFFYTGDSAAFFPGLMPDEEGNLVTVYGFSSIATAPLSAYVTRRITFPSGAFHDSGVVLFSGASGTSGRWGDFEATSYDGPASNHMWIAAQQTKAGGDWATGIGKVTFTLNQP
jgi:hypothetical protein